MESAWANSETSNFRMPTITEDSRIFNRQGMQNVGFSRPAAPPVPPRPYGGNSMSSFNSGIGNSYFGGGYGGGFGGFSPYGMSGMYGSGFGRYGGFGGYGYNSMGGGDAENRFIQIAEESSRSAFQSIESVVNAVLNIAQMLESTYFALTSSFRAVLGVAANFGRLRGLFSQFWTSFALFRTFNWIFRKVLYMLRLSNIDPGSKAMQEAFAAAQSGETSPDSPQKSSSLAVITFLAFITIGPYLLMKLLGTVSNTAIEETKNPKAWSNPIEAIAQYDFVASSPAELSVRSGQNIVVAPKSVQNVHKLLDSGWVLASIDGVTSGLIPVNYIESTKQAKLKEPAVPPNMPTVMPSIPEETNVKEDVLNSDSDMDKVKEL